MWLYMYVPKSQSRTPKTYRTTSAYENTRMEVVRSGNGFHSRFTPHPERYDSIWVIVDRLTKVAHFLPVKTTYIGAKLAELYMERIVRMHGVLKKIVLDRRT